MFPIKWKIRCYSSFLNYYSSKSFVLSNYSSPRFFFLKLLPFRFLNLQLLLSEIIPPEFLSFLRENIREIDSAPRELNFKSIRVSMGPLLEFLQGNFKNSIHPPLGTRPRVPKSLPSNVNTLPRRPPVAGASELQENSFGS